MTVRKYTRLRELPGLEGWLTFGEAADDLGLTSERVRQMAMEGKLNTACHLGRRPVGVVREEEVQAILLRRRETGDRAAVAAADFVPAPVAEVHFSG